MLARTALAAAAALAAAGLPACGGASSEAPGARGGASLGAASEANPARVEVRRLDARPHLAIVARDGDPTPAIVAAVVTDLGPAASTALAAVVESRLRAAGFEVDTRVHRDAFHVRLLLAEAGRAGAFFTALVGAFARPVAPRSPEVALAAQRLASLKRNPLDAPELVPVTACTGALGVAANDPPPDVSTDAGVQGLEAWRKAALHAGHAAVAAVGPAAYVAAVASALERSSGWPIGAAPLDPWPSGDAVGVYTAPAIERRGARVTLAARVADPGAAAAAAERIGAPDSPLATRLRALPGAWRLVEVTGVARPRGGCLSVSVEVSQRAPGVPIEPEAALVAALVRGELSAELAAGAGAAAGRQIVTAADPREAASRAAWWALAGPSQGSPARWATALGVPPAERSGDAATAAFRAALDRSVAAAAVPVAERRALVERGQGELWLLLASPCGVAEEGTDDAGLGALAVLASTDRRRDGGVAVEPWITSDGLGVVAHAPFRDERETAAQLARRVADAAARALAAPPLSPEVVTDVRASLLDHLERTTGRQGAAFEALAGALSPEHPSWLDPFGLFRRVASASPERVRARGLALAGGALRAAVIANADAAQAEAALAAVDRWLTPSFGPRTCRPSPAPAPRPGRIEVRAPEGGGLAHGFVGLTVPLPGAPGRDLAELTALALDGDGGLLATALASSGAAASARIVGGARAPALLVDVRAPADALAAAVADVKALLARLPSSASDADLARAVAAAARRDLEARAAPRRRLADLWLGRKAAAPGRPTLAAWRAFLGGALRDASLVVVESRAD